MWQEVHGYVTPGGDPVWKCGYCGGNEHVYGIETWRNKQRICNECGRLQIYPGECRYLYYMLMRPVGPGCQPPGLINCGSMDGKTVIPETGHHAWGWAEYERPLTEKELRDYEMSVAEEYNAVSK